MERKARILNVFMFASGRVFRWPLGDPRTAYWIGVRDALGAVLDGTVERLTTKPDSEAVNTEEGEAAPMTDDAAPITAKRVTWACALAKTPNRLGRPRLP